MYCQPYFLFILNLKLPSVFCCPLTNKDVQCLVSPSRLCSMQQYIHCMALSVCHCFYLCNHQSVRQDICNVEFKRITVTFY